MSTPSPYDYQWFVIVGGLVQMMWPILLQRQ